MSWWGLGFTLGIAACYAPSLYASKEKRNAIGVTHQIKVSGWKPLGTDQVLTELGPCLSVNGSCKGCPLKGYPKATSGSCPHCGAEAFSSLSLDDGSLQAICPQGCAHCDPHTWAGEPA